MTKLTNRFFLERTRAINTAKNKLNLTGDDKIEVFDSFFKDAPHDAKPLWFLGKAFELLANADVVFFVKGWDAYRGCKIENRAAHEYLEPNGTLIIEE